MTVELSPLVSEFETEEQAASYSAWLKAKVQSSLEESSPSLSHDAVMARARELLERKRASRAAD